MKPSWRLVAAWLQALLLAAVPWMAAWQPVWVPVVLACALVLRPLLRTVGPAEPWASAVAAVSALVALVVGGGWQVAGGWLLLAALAGALRMMAGERRVLLARAADQVAVAGWGAAFALRPELLAVEAGGWLAPAMLLLMSRRLLAAVSRHRPARTAVLAPPSREVRGTLSLNDVVLAGRDALPRSVPTDLELRAGESLGVLCDSPDDVQALAATLTGRRPPRKGEVAVDGVPLVQSDRLVAVVALGEPFLAGDLDDNLAALCDEELDMSQVSALVEACSLAEAAQVLERDRMREDGEPLPGLERLLVQAARVIPSEYRVVVVVDPMPWLNTVRGEMWRSAVVRASLGRTAVWLTSDRELARRAARVMEFRHGALRSYVGHGSNGGRDG